MLGPVSSHTAAETRQVVASLGSQRVAGHSGDHPPDLETLRATPARPHQILIQGNLARRLLLGSQPVEKASEGTARFVASLTAVVRVGDVERSLIDRG